MENSVFLMGWPKGGYSIDAPINAAMIAGMEVCRTDPQKFNKDAQGMWRLVMFKMRELGLQVLDTEPQHGGGDAVFVRDKLACIDSHVILSRFASETRRVEIEDVRRIISSQYLVEFEDEASFFEGGDCLATPFNMTVLGYGPRSSFAAHQELRKKLPHMNFLSLELAASAFDGTQDSLMKADFFHADTAACFLPQGDLLIYRDAFTEKSWRMAEELARENGREVYQLSMKEAGGFVANIKALTPNLLITTALNTDPEKNGHVINWLRSRGYDLWKWDCTPFLMSGGGPHCLIHEVPYHTLTNDAREMVTKQRQAFDLPSVRIA